jgi:hypothetical protein
MLWKFLAACPISCRVSALLKGLENISIIHVMCYKKHPSFPPQRFALQLLLLPPHVDTEDVLLRLVPNTGCENTVYILQILHKETELACLMLKKKGRSSMATEIVGPSL